MPAATASPTVAVVGVLVDGDLAPSYLSLPLALSQASYHLNASLYLPLLSSRLRDEDYTALKILIDLVCLDCGSTSALWNAMTYHYLARYC